MQNHLKELFEYNLVSNQKYIDFLTQNRVSLEEYQIKLINHLLNAHQIWNARILDESSFEVWQINDWNALHQLNQNNYAKTLEILERYDVYTEITYQNSKGETFSNNVKDILTHVINHSTYHRAQIASSCAKLGLHVPNSDYIFFKRKSL